jgi:deoxyadenosine/deoxycytidine kinase
MVRIISINGNIACGKSTLISALKNKGYDVVLEGYNRGEWGNVLSMYYKNPKRYGYLFQTLVIAEMKEAYERIREEAILVGKNDDDIVFVERSHVDCLAFAQLVHKNGDMTDVEFKTFKRLYNLLLEQPDLIISLNLEPDVCFERCKARGRECESDLNVEYLRGVHNSTNSAMLENSNNPNAPVLMDLDVLGMQTADIVERIEEMSKSKE